MINDTPEFKRLITSDEFMTEFLNSFDVEEQESPYCPECGSCGESGCCSPDMCSSVRLHQIIQSLLEESMTNKYFTTIDFINQLQERFKCGSYCEWNLKSYKEMAEECNDYYLALKELKKFFTSKNEIPVERATILTKTFNEIVGDLV